jgi:hypothetical protein
MQIKHVARESVFANKYLVSLQFQGRTRALTWAKASPRAQPTREVNAFAVKGFLSRALVYASHPGTAPPLVTSGFRNRGLETAVPLRREETRAGFFVTDFWTLATVDEVTPKALTARQKVAKMVAKSFMVLVVRFYDA